MQHHLLTTLRFPGSQVANADVRDELRNPDQVRKARKEEEKKMEHLQRVSYTAWSLVG